MSDSQFDQFGRLMREIYGPVPWWVWAVIVGILLLLSIV